MMMFFAYHSYLPVSGGITAREKGVEDDNGLVQIPDEDTFETSIVARTSWSTLPTFP